MNFIVIIVFRQQQQQQQPFYGPLSDQYTKNNNSVNFKFWKPASIK